MLVLQVDNDKLQFSFIRQVNEVMRCATIARLTVEDQLEYCQLELGKILRLADRPLFKVVRGGHHVAIVATGYPHACQAMIREVLP